MYGMNLTAAAIDTVIAAAGFSGLVLCCGEFKKRKKHAGRKSAARLLMKHTALAKAELKKIKSIKSVFNAGKVRKEIAEGIAIMRNRIASNSIIIQEGSWALSTERRNAKEQLEIERDCMESKKRRPILWGVLCFFIRKR